MSAGAGLVVIDRAASTVEIAGRRFPVVALICPLAPGQRDEGERDRALGGDRMAYIPAENGVLFRVEEYRNEHYHGIDLEPAARTCHLHWHVDEALYLPWSVLVIDGELAASTEARPFCDWRYAEGDWVVETIDRLSRKPFMQPPGEPARLVPLNYFREMCDA